MFVVFSAYDIDDTECDKVIYIYANEVEVGTLLVHSDNPERKLVFRALCETEEEATAFIIKLKAESKCRNSIFSKRSS
jgi:hypothetical protein